jgi:preprotein translocase subunit SecD
MWWRTRAAGRTVPGGRVASSHDAWCDATCPTGQMAIVVAGEVISAPVIQAASFDRDRIEISGTFTERSAEDLAGLLNLGPPPVTLRPG